MTIPLDGLSEADYCSIVAELDPISLNHTVSTLSSDVSRCVVNLVQYSESYYFLEVNPQTSLPNQVSYVLRLQEVTATSEHSSVRVASERLRGAMDALSTELGRQFLSLKDRSSEEVFHAYGQDHGYHQKSDGTRG